MNALKNMPVSFPGLFGEWEFTLDPVAIHIGNGIYWYGIILAAAMLAGMFLGLKKARQFGLTEDNVIDVVIWAVPSCIIGARIYYVLFNLDFYRTKEGVLQWSKMIAVWDGGIAIYGAVIAAALVVFIYGRRKKIPFGAIADLGVMGLLVGQAIGRWANFVNREAFGDLTDLPWRMKVWISSNYAVEVHPTFLYESLWNIIGLLLILFIISKGRRFDGENTCFYFIWYGIGRAMIEGLRTDSLYLFDWTFQGQPIRVSQVLSLVMVVVAVLIMFYNLGIRKKTADGLYVNRLAAEAQRKAELEAAEEAAIIELLNEERTVPAETEQSAEEVVLAEEAAESVPVEIPVEVQEETGDGSEN